MIEHAVKDTPINLYIYRLRQELYDALGITKGIWLQKFEKMFFKCLDGDDALKFHLATTMCEYTTKALMFGNIDYQDVLEALGDYNPS